MKILIFEISAFTQSLLHFAHHCRFQQRDLAGFQCVVWWIHETIWVLFFMRHNGHNILQWHGRVFVGGPPLIHSSIWVPACDGWVAFCEDREQVRCWSVILPWHYLEQQEAHKCIAHTWEKVTEKNGEQQQIASQSHYWSHNNMLPSLPHWSMWTEGSGDLEGELWRCDINLVWVFFTFYNEFFVLPSQGKNKKADDIIFHFWFFLVI